MGFTVKLFVHRGELQHKLKFSVSRKLESPENATRTEENQQTDLITYDTAPSGIQTRVALVRDERSHCYAIRASPNR